MPTLTVKINFDDDDQKGYYILQRLIQTYGDNLISALDFYASSLDDYTDYGKEYEELVKIIQKDNKKKGDI